MISVIIPAYNASATIERCLKSIKEQNLALFEAIIVDDGSTDNTLDLCYSIVENDSRFHIIHQNNEGVSSARNRGMEVAAGEYICFMDADDEISPNYLEDLLDGIDSCDLLIHGMLRSINGKLINRKMNVEGVFDLDKDAASFFNQINIERYGGPYCKLYRKSIIEENNLRFDIKVRLAEDLDFLLRYLTYCHVVKTQNRCNYIYYDVAGSATTRIYSIDDEYSVLCALDRSWDALYSLFDIASLHVLHQKSLSYYMARIIASVDREDCSRTQRINCLSSIPDYVIEAYSRFYIPQTRYMTLVKYLICHRMFAFFDVVCLLRGLIKIRRK